MMHARCPWPLFRKIMFLMLVIIEKLTFKTSIYHKIIFFIIIFMYTFLLYIKLSNQSNQIKYLKYLISQITPYLNLIKSNKHKFNFDFDLSNSNQISNIKSNCRSLS